MADPPPSGYCPRCGTCAHAAAQFPSLASLGIPTQIRLGWQRMWQRSALRRRLKRGSNLNRTTRLPPWTLNLNLINCSIYTVAALLLAGIYLFFLTTSGRRCLLSLPCLFSYSLFCPSLLLGCKCIPTMDSYCCAATIITIPQRFEAENSRVHRS
jgi:hypothetical protein